MDIAFWTVAAYAFILSAFSLAVMCALSEECIKTKELKSDLEDERRRCDRLDSLNKSGFKLGQIMKADLEGEIERLKAELAESYADTRHLCVAIIDRSRTLAEHFDSKAKKHTEAKPVNS